MDRNDIVILREYADLYWSRAEYGWVHPQELKELEEAAQEATIIAQELEEF